MYKQKEKTIEQFRKERLLMGDCALLITQTDAIANNPNRTWKVRLNSHIDKKEIDILKQVAPNGFSICEFTVMQPLLFTAVTCHFPANLGQYYDCF
jgi:hypothetical protein